MSFNIKVDGQTVHEVDVDPRLVTGVRLHSAAGESGVAGTPFSGEGNDWVNLTLDLQQPTALPVVEDDARLAAQEEGPQEVLTYNENAQREAALEAVNEEYAAKAAESGEDVSAEKGEAEAAALNPETRASSEVEATSEEPAAEEEATESKSSRSKKPTLSES